MMDLDSAIQHCKEQVQEQAKKGCYSCAEEHQQLAEWLKELKAYRKAWEKAKRTVRAYLILEEFGRGYQDDIEKLIEECKPKEGNAE